jgi:hypothetical protein
MNEAERLLGLFGGSASSDRRTRIRRNSHLMRRCSLYP